MNFKRIMSCFLSTTCSFSLCFSYKNINSFAEENNNDISIFFERSGVLPEGDNYKNLAFYEGEINEENVEQINTRSIPSYVDLSTDPCFPPLGHQGGLGSCVAFATTYYQFSYEVNKLNNVTSAYDRVVYSPKWTYNSINEGADNGSYITDALTILKNYGALKLSDLPYDNDYTWLPGNTNISSNEMITEKIEALGTRISSFGSTSLPSYGTFIYNAKDSDLTVIKSLLNSGKVLTITTPTSFNYKNGIDHNNSTITVNYRCYAGGAHAMAVVGYDDDVWCDVNNNGIVEACEKGAFKMANSYGTAGVSNDTNGYKWVLYDAINEVSANTVNSWEQNLYGTRVQALRCETSEPTFWYLNVAKYDVNYVGEIEINTGTNKLSSCQYTIGRAATGYSPIYNNQDMLPGQKGGSSYNGKILFDYDNLCTPILSYLNGYNWYVNFTSLNGNYNFKILDNSNNMINDYGSSNSIPIKYVNINLMLGDVNYSGNLTSDDSTAIQDYLLHLRTFSNLQKELADYNQDGTVDLADAIYILQHIYSGG